MLSVNVVLVFLVLVFVLVLILLLLRCHKSLCLKNPIHVWAIFVVVMLTVNVEACKT